MIGGLPDGRPVTLADLLMDADALNASIRTFDEVSFGLPRLVAGGFVDIGRTKRGGAAGDRDTR